MKRSQQPLSPFLITLFCWSFFSFALIQLCTFISASIGFFILVFVVTLSTFPAYYFVALKRLLSTRQYRGSVVIFSVCQITFLLSFELVFSHVYLPFFFFRMILMAVGSLLIGLLVYKVLVSKMWIKRT